VPADSFRIVIDTNTLLRGLVATSSASAKIKRAAERRTFVTLLSKPVLDEYRAVLLDENIARRFPAITPRVVELTIRRLQYIGEFVRVPKTRFEYDRDERDRPFIELAIALDATHIISADKDLLSLPESRGEAGKRFRQRLPGVKVLDAPSFLRAYGKEIEMS